MAQLVWLLIGGGLVYVSICLALLYTSRTYSLPLPLVLIEVIGSITSCVSLSGTFEIVMIALGVFILPVIYLGFWAIEIINLDLNKWKYGRRFEVYRSNSFLGLATYNFHLEVNTSTTVLLEYMIWGPTIFFALIVALNYPGHASHMFEIILVLNLILFAAAIKSLDRGYLKLRAPRRDRVYRGSSSPGSGRMH